MSDVRTIETETLQGIADAIRGKTGSDEEIPVTDYAKEISNLEAGGGGNSPLRYGSGKNSIVGGTSKAIGTESVAIGSDNLAGAKAFTIIAVDENAKTYTLDSVEGLEVGDVYSLRLLCYNASTGKTDSPQKYNYGSITEIDAANNKVTVDKLFGASDVGEGFAFQYTEEYADENGIDYETNAFKIVAKPLVGTRVIGSSAVAIGSSNKAISKNAFAEGFGNTAYGSHSHAEGYGTEASYAAHSEGKNNKASGHSSHAEGENTVASAHTAHSEGYGAEASAQFAHAEGYYTRATKNQAHAEGNGTTASNYSAHAEGDGTVASGDSSHAEGVSTKATAKDAHAEGNATEASGVHSHAEGQRSKATYNSTHAEGFETTSSGDASHSEGYKAKATAQAAHAEGKLTEASGIYSHAEGNQTKATNNSAHSEGYKTEASGDCSHAGGQYTKATGQAQYAIGKYNAEDPNAYFLVGCGTSESNRKNGFGVRNDGRAFVGAEPVADNDVPTRKFVVDMFNGGTGSRPVPAEKSSKTIEKAGYYYIHAQNRSTGDFHSFGLTYYNGTNTIWCASSGCDMNMTGMPDRHLMLKIVRRYNSVTADLKCFIAFGDTIEEITDNCTFYVTEF